MKLPRVTLCESANTIAFTELIKDNGVDAVEEMLSKSPVHACAYAGFIKGRFKLAEANIKADGYWVDTYSVITGHKL